MILVLSKWGSGFGYRFPCVPVLAIYTRWSIPPVGEIPSCRILIVAVNVEAGDCCLIVILGRIGIEIMGKAEIGVINGDIDIKMVRR